MRHEEGHSGRSMATDRVARAPRFDPSLVRKEQAEGRIWFEDRFDVSRETSDALATYVDLLTEWQERMNLVAASTLGSAWQRHIADSVQFASLLPKFETAVDLGSGGGFPGIVIAIANPSSRVHLVESVGKKASFLRAVADRLSLNTHVHAKRIEASDSVIQRTDIVTARALASLTKLCGLVAPSLRPDARCFFAKGANHEAEIAEARQAWRFDCERTASSLADGSVVLELRNIRRR